jgi:hypothetical protein
MGREDRQKRAGGKSEKIPGKSVRNALKMKGRVAVQLTPFG